MTDQEKLTKYQSQPERFVIASNGAVWDRDTGRFCDMISSMNPHSITPATAPKLAARRKELAQQAAIEGIDEAAIEAGLIPRDRAGSGEGWKAINKHVAATLLASKNLRGQAEAANFLGKASQLINDQNGNSRDVALALAELLGQVLEHEQPTVIEGTVRNG